MSECEYPDSRDIFIRSGEKTQERRREVQLFSPRYVHVELFRDQLPDLARMEENDSMIEHQ